MLSIFIWIGLCINLVLLLFFFEGMFVFLMGCVFIGEFFDFNFYVGEVGYGLIFGLIEGGKFVFLGFLVV